MKASIRASMLLGSTALVAGGALAGAAFAQEKPAEASGKVEEITVIGTQIKGAKITGALPVSVVSQSDIIATGAVSAGELFRDLPQAGDVSFNEQVLGGTSPNAARGDVSTVTLRGLGQGNTLLLLNGRRVVPHPTTQTDGFGSPVFGYNANAIPVDGLDRVEVLRDGASALYGSDAVAGVVNNVLKNDFRGMQVDAQYGYAEGTHLREIELNGIAGKSFADGKGNVELFVGYDAHGDIKVSDLPETRSSDRRSLIPAGSFTGNASFDGDSTSEPFGSFQSPVSFGTVKSGTTSITNASGVFHIQPTTFAGCAIQLGGGLCYGSGTLTGTALVPMRFDSNLSYPNTSVQPALIGRLNLYTQAHYDVNDALRLYTELGYYTATTDQWGGSSGSLSSIPITIAANAYYNPFGPVSSPNRIAGLNIPAAGLPLTITSLNITDAGPNEDKVVNNQYRVLFGAKGLWHGWNYDSALLYNVATVADTSTGISSTLFQAAVNKTTPDAYNPFTGGSPTTPNIGDPTLNPASVVNQFKIHETRADRTELDQWDFKLSRPDVITLWSGPVGLATGFEVRHETYFDNRDSHQDGSIKYTDQVTGIVYGDDLFGASPSPDVRGQRTVESLYGELGIPVVSPEWHIPLVHAVDLQVAGRFENYSDVGSVAKPKIAGNWDIVDGVRFRGSWSQGFRAPNLETLNSPLLSRSNSATDYIRCDMDLLAGRISSFSTCSESFSVVRNFSGNSNLKPETSTSYSFGAVLQPKFIPDRFGALTLTVDRWHIDQIGVVGVFDYQSAITLDYLDRLQGKTNPNVVRAPVTADDIALAAGTGLAPVGQVQTVNGVYTNLQPRTVAGVDIGINYKLSFTPIGSFRFDFNYAKLTDFFQTPSADQTTLLNAQAAGIIQKSIAISGAASLIGQSGNPSDKWSTTTTWDYGPAEIGLFTQYTSPIQEVGVVDPSGNTWVVKALLTANVYGQWTINRDKPTRTSFRFGVRNVGNTPPPLSSAGYLAATYSPVPRYWYMAIHKSF
jgi:outer membrane receptor protein involved in Fe transport